MNILISEEIKIYKCCDIDNPFKTREGETIVNLDRYVEVLKENNIPLIQEQYKDAENNLITLNKKE